MNPLHHELQNEDQTSLRAKAFHALREIVFGLEDGIVSTLGAITGIAAGTNNRLIVILSGVVVIFVESLSMAAGTYLSSKSEREAEEHILAEERKEIEDDPEKETQELVEFYSTRGFTPDEVQMLVNRVTSNKELWLEEMAYRELGVIPNPKLAPKTDALFMGVFYIIGGLVPLASYIFLPIRIAIPLSIAVSVVTLFFVGYTKGRIVNINRVRSGIEMTVVSLSAAAVGYVIGNLVGNIFHL